MEDPARSTRMKISVYIPKDLEVPLRERAAEVGESPSLFVQSLLRQRLEGPGKTFSEEFAALAGSWEDDRSVEEIVRDVEENRTSALRSELR
jgi:hypothetical protein